MTNVATELTSVETLVPKHRMPADREECHAMPHLLAPFYVNMTTTNQRIPALDGWRTEVVSLVVISHLAYFSALSVRTKGWIPKGMGALGVHIFFVISGYVICSALMYARRCKTSPQCADASRARHDLGWVPVFADVIDSIGTAWQWDRRDVPHFAAKV
jgi:hypothetical protein